MKTKRPTVIFFLCFLAYTAIYIARLNFSMASSGLRDAGVMTASGIGILGSVFLVVYATGRLINGALSDVVPPWVMISSGLTLCGVANVIFSFFPPLVGLAVLWGVNAYAQSMLWSSILRILTAIYDADRVKKKTMAMVTAVTVGNIIGIVANSLFISEIGLAYAFVIPGGLALAFAVIMAATTKNLDVPTAKRGEHIPIYRLIVNPDVLPQIIPSVAHGIIKDNISLWMAVYVIDRYGLDLNSSALFVLFIPSLGLVARLIYPSVFRIVGENEHRVTALSFAVCIPSALVLLIPSLPPIGAVVCLGIIFAAVSMANTSLLSVFPIRFASSGNVASVSGLIDFATYFGAGIGSFAYGYLVEGFGYVPMIVSWALFSAVSLVPVIRVVMKERKR